MEMTKYKLGDLCRIASSKRIFESEYVEKGVPFIRGQEISDGSILDPKASFECYISQSRYEEIKEKYGKPTKGDILITAVGTIGNLCYLDKDIDFYFKDGNVIWFSEIISSCEGKFLFHFMKSSFFKDQLKYFMIGAVQKALTIDMLKKVEVPLPPLSEQKKIASVLSALDDKIALNKKMNQKLEAMAKRLYDYWFVQFDFPDKNGHPYKTTGGPMTYNPTLKREIPVGWEVKTLDEYLDCNKYSLTAKSSYDFIQYLDTSSLTENTLESLQKYGSQAESPSRAKRIVYANDILYSTVRPQQKHYGIIKNPAQNMIASTGFAILSCKYGSEYNDMFYLFLIQEKNLIKLSAIADSNASSYPSFNPSDLLNLSICLPEDIKTIEPLVKKFSSLFGIIERNQKENQKLTALRDKLLPLLMNGQVVVG